MVLIFVCLVFVVREHVHGASAACSAFSEHQNLRSDEVQFPVCRDEQQVGGE